jgi:hypothetical protein
MLLLGARVGQVLIALAAAGAVIRLVAQGHADAWSLPILVAAIGSLERLEARLAPRPRGNRR